MVSAGWGGYLGFPLDLSDLEVAQALLRRGQEEELGWALLEQTADALGYAAKAIAISPKGRLALELLGAPPEPWASLGWGLALTPDLLDLFFSNRPQDEDPFADPWG